MNTTLSSPSYPILLTCRTQHQHWALELSQSEQEIDQLMSLLAELPYDTYRSLDHHAIDYTQRLRQLKTRIRRLLTDAVCPGIACSSANVAAVPCPDPHFVPTLSGNSLIASVSAEYSQLKDRCHRFLSELMRLNLI